MSTSKAVYVIAVVVPFGLVALITVAVAHTLYQRRRYRRIAERAGMCAVTTPMMSY